MSDYQPTQPYVYQPDPPPAGWSGDPATWRIYGVGGPFDLRRGLTKGEAQSIVAILIEAHASQSNKEKK